MKINKIHIDNFGKLTNFDYQFKDNLNVLCFENGFGKTTLSIFIKAMFYGMGAGRENIKTERKKYWPWQGGEFGGYIEFEQAGNEYRLIRKFAKTPEGDSVELVDLSTYQKLAPSKMEIGEEIFGVGKDTFEITAFFPQLNFNAGGNEKVGSNLLGLDKYESDMASVQQGISNLKDKKSLIKKAIPKKEEIAILKSSKKQKELGLLNIESDISSLKKQLNKQKEDLAEINSKYEEVKSQSEREEKILESRRKIESQIYAKSEEITKGYNKLELLEQSQPQQQKNNKKYLYLILMIVMGLVGVADILLFAMNIFVWTIFVAIALVVIIVEVICISFFNKSKTPPTSTNKTEVEELKRKINDDKQALKSLKELIENYVISEIDYGQECEALQRQLYDYKSNIDKTQFALENLLRDKDEENERLEELDNLIETKTKSIVEGAEKLKLIEDTIDFLKQAYENVSKRLVAPMNNAISDLLGEFDLEDRKFVVDSGFNIFQDTSAGLKEYEYSSQGIKDLLSFCMRIYLIKEIYKKEMPFIILDDSFVNLDDKNFSSMKKLLKKYASDYQIIYMCCNKNFIVE